MPQHFPTVSVETALSAPYPGSKSIRPLVLVVDDEPLIAETLAIILNGNGLATLTAPNAAEALETAALIPPELLIADLAMPGMNGLDMAIEISRMTPDCRVILFSGHASTGDMFGKMLKLGHSFEWLIKPVHPADLLERVFAVLGKRGSPFGPYRPARTPTLYDFLTAESGGDGFVSSSWNLRSRGRAGSGNPIP